VRGPKERRLRREYRRLDVSKEEDWSQVVEFCQDKFGTPSILVNNAGTFSAGQVHNENLDQWVRILDIDLTGVFLGMRSLIPVMQSYGDGAIVNNSSIWGLVSAEGAAACRQRRCDASYKECGSGIRQGRYSGELGPPGAIKTAMLDFTGQANEDRGVARTPMGWTAKAHEVAEAILFLASDEASYITGAALPVDGGYTALTIRHRWCNILYHRCRPGRSRGRPHQAGWPCIAQRSHTPVPLTQGGTL
jgi:3alpha(or 20beta)-hydroxysteroid dehydrogenase